MGLRIIYGRSGTGKTTLCLNEIKQNIEKEEKLLFITPEQFSFNAEKSLVDLLGKNASINAEVLTFKRMAYRVLSQVGKGSDITLTKSGKAMIIYNILLKQKENLKILGKSSTIDGNSDIITRSITEFKRHNVCIDDLKNILPNVEDVYLKTKITEIINVYEKYEQSILNNYIDSDDNLTQLSNLIEQTTMFNNSTIWIDEFNGFTTQEYNVIAKLLKICKNVNISICTDSIILDESKKGIDIFYTSKKTINKLINIANENNVAIQNPTYLDNEYRFKNKELSHLEKNLFNIPYKVYEKDCNNISIFLAQNPYTEIENIAGNIVDLVKNKGYRYKDISVITKNAEGYSNLINAIFKQYGIPVFMDLESDLSSNILIKYVLSIFDILYKNWSYESVFNYLKTGLVDLDKDDINYLENYVLKWGIRGNTWYKDDWKFGFELKTDNENEKFIKINQIRKKVIQPILEFKENIPSKKNVLEITKAIYEFLKVQNIQKKLDEKILFLKHLGNMQMANEYTLTWNMLMNIFDELVLVLGEEKISFEDYKNVLRYGLMQNKITTIPSTLDQVIIGDTDRTRSHKVKVMFIIGMIDGVFPTSNNDEGFINDKDRETFARLWYGAC